MGLKLHNINNLDDASGDASGAEPAAGPRKRDEGPEGDRVHVGGRVLGTRLLEKVIADTSVRPDLRDLIYPAEGAWDLEFPDLTALGLEVAAHPGIRICIATEDIVGPVRNGGIGTTYSFLARILAAEGFDVTILYLRGDYVEIGDIDHWIGHYAALGVRFLTVEDYYRQENGAGNSDRWTGPMYNMFRHLRDNHYDIVHVSEWRGSGYLSLLAKRQGLYFDRTHFVVKCSSPWLWNRLYGSHPLKTIGDLDKIHAEQKSVELGDHIIGGSGHLLRWMASQGYDLAIGRTFVQPNILSTAALDPIIAERANRPGDLIPADEIVFFGRLEARKGIDVFCEAVDNLIRRGVRLPPKITFMGKPGARLETRPDLEILEFLREATADWPVDVQILTEFQQEQALRYLLGGNRLAVMPSIIENSSLAVYEAVICGIPFIASNSGGTPELIDPVWHEDVLCDAHPYALAQQMEKAISRGGRVAAPTFDNAHNTQTWIDYHRSFPLWHKGAMSAQTGDIPLPHVSVVVPHRDQLDALKLTLSALENCGYPNLTVHVVDDGSHETRTLIELDLLRQKIEKRNWRFSMTPGIETSLAANQAVAGSDSAFVFFTRPGHALLPGALERLVRVALTRNLGVATGFSLEYAGSACPDDPTEALRLHMPILGNPAYTMLASPDWHWDLLVRREAFEAVGGFTGDFRQLNEEKELCHAIELNGWRAETMPEAINWIRMPDVALLTGQRYNLRASAIRPLRPAVRYGPLFFRNLLLLAFGVAQRSAGLDEQLRLIRADRDAQREAKILRTSERDSARARLAANQDELQRLKADRDALLEAKRLHEAERDDVRRRLAKSLLTTAATPSSGRQNPVDTPTDPTDMPEPATTGPFDARNRLAQSVLATIATVASGRRDRTPETPAETDALAKVTAERDAALARLAQFHLGQVGKGRDTALEARAEDLARRLKERNRELGKMREKRDALHAEIRKLRSARDSGEVRSRSWLRRRLSRILAGLRGGMGRR